MEIWHRQRLTYRGVSSNLWNTLHPIPDAISHDNRWVIVNCWYQIINTSVSSLFAFDLEMRWMAVQTPAPSKFSTNSIIDSISITTMMTLKLSNTQLLWFLIGLLCWCRSVRQCCSTEWLSQTWRLLSMDLLSSIIQDWRRGWCN